MMTVFHFINDKVRKIIIVLIIHVLSTFRRKVGFDFDRGSMVGVRSKFFERFEVKGLRKNYFHEFIYI